MRGAALPSFHQADRRRRAFLVTYGASHVAKIVPVVRELERRGVECLVMALTVGYKRAQQLGLHPLGYIDFLSLVRDPDAVLAVGATLTAENNHPDVARDESICYLGINFQEWVDTLGVEGAEKAYATRGRQGFMPVNFMGRVLDALQPGVVVATSTPRSEEACIRAAAARGIPTLTMVDLFAPPSDPFLRRPVQADVVTVVSEEVRERFLAAGLGQTQVRTTGSPDFDALFDPATRSAATEFRRRQRWDGLRVVMWAGILELENDSVPAEYRGAGLALQVETVLRRWVEMHENVALIVRYHPNQHHQFANLGAQERVYLSNPGQEPIAFLLHASDVVIHQISTAGFEAALLKKRVLYLGFSTWVANVDFDLSSFGPSECVQTLGELPEVLDSLGEECHLRKMHVPDGPAAPRVASEVIGLLNSRSAW